MERSKIGWGIIWRMTLWGLGLGIALGALYGLLVASIIGFLYGALIGGAAGLLLGAIDGFVMALFTHLAFYPVTIGRFRFYRVAMIATSIAIAGCVLIWFYGGGTNDLLVAYLILLLSYRNPFGATSLSVILPSLIPYVIAIVASGFASTKVSDWTIFQSLSEPTTVQVSAPQPLSNIQ